MEHLFRTPDDCYRMGTPLRLLHLLLVAQGIGVMASRRKAVPPHRPGAVDICLQQDRQALGPLLPLPSRRCVHSHLHRLRLLPRMYQVLGSLDTQRCK